MPVTLSQFGLSTTVARRVVSAGTALVLVWLLSACTPLGVPGPHDYDSVNQAAKDLHLSKYGQVIYTGHFGSEHRIEGNPPTVIKVATGTDQTYGSVLAELPRHGYTLTGEDSWTRGSGKSTIYLILKELKPGDNYNDSDGARHVVRRPGVNLMIYTG